MNDRACELLRGPRRLVLVGLIAAVCSVGCAVDEVDSRDSEQIEAELVGAAKPGSIRWSKTITPDYPRHGADVQWRAVPKSVFADDNGLISVLVDEVDSVGSLSQSVLYRLKPNGEVLRSKTFRSTSSLSRLVTAAFLRTDGSIVISTLASPAPGGVYAIASDDRVLWSYRDLPNHATSIVAIDANGNPILSSSLFGSETVKLDGATGKESWRIKMPPGTVAGAGTTDASGSLWLVVGGGAGPSGQPRWDLSRFDDSGAIVETIPDFSRGRSTPPLVSPFGNSFLALEVSSRIELRLFDVGRGGARGIDEKISTSLDVVRWWDFAVAGESVAVSTLQNGDKTRHLSVFDAGATPKRRWSHNGPEGNGFGIPSAIFIRKNSVFESGQSGDSFFVTRYVR